MTWGRVVACVVVALMGGGLVAFGGVLLRDSRNGRVGNVLLMLIGVVMLAVVALAIVYR